MLYYLIGFFDIFVIQTVTNIMDKQDPGAFLVHLETLDHLVQVFAVVVRALRLLLFPGLLGREV